MGRDITRIIFCYHTCGHTEGSGLTSGGYKLAAFYAGYPSVYRHKLSDVVTQQLFNLEKSGFFLLL